MLQQDLLEEAIHSLGVIGATMTKLKKEGYVKIEKKRSLAGTPLTSFLPAIETIIELCETLDYSVMIVGARLAS